MMRRGDWGLPPMIWHQKPNPYFRVFDMVEVEGGDEGNSFFDADTVILNEISEHGGFAFGVWEWLS